MSWRDPEAAKAYARARYAKNREQDLAKSKAYREAHREEIAAKARAYRLAHLEEERARARSYRKRNPDRDAEYHHAYYLRNKDRFREYHRRYRQADPERRRNADRLWRYGLSQHVVDQILEHQQNACAICRHPFDGQGKLGTPHIDHEHGGDVRGILCHKCNSCLGLVGDNPDRLQSAIDYLTSPPARLFLTPQLKLFA